MPLLEVKNLTIRFGGLVAVEDLSLTVNAGQIYSIIGPNGAGKTTVFNAISGVYTPSKGVINFAGTNSIAAWNSQDTLLSALTGIISSILFLFAVSLERLWSNSITSIYQYNQSFDWSLMLANFISTLNTLSITYLTIPLFIGFILGLAGYIALWLRARATPDKIAARGIRRTFQNIRLFGDLSVEENLLLGLHSNIKNSLLSVGLRTQSFYQELAIAQAKVRETLKIVGLSKFVDVQAGSLSYGDQRRVEIARALIAEPKLLILDEPAAGMNPAESAELIELIRRIRDSGVTILLIEHDMRIVMQISDYITVLHYGKKIAEGNAYQVRNDPLVVEAYLGKGIRG